MKFRREDHIDGTDWHLTITWDEIKKFVIFLVLFVIISVVFDLSFWFMCLGWIIYRAWKQWYREEQNNRDDMKGQ